MNFNRNTLLVLVVIAVFLIFLFFINQEVRSGLYEPQAVSSEKNETNAIVQPSNVTVLVSQNVCEGCHLSGKRSIPQALAVSPHINGGKYCLSCHVISHQEHPMKERGVMCENCHGNTKNPVTPVYSNGNIP